MTSSPPHPSRSFLRGVVFLAWLVAACAQAEVTATRDSLGDGLRVALPAAAVLLTMAQGDREGVRQLGFSVLLAEGTTAALKAGLHRPRPDGTGNGFPSGHATTAFVSAAYVYRRYGATWAVPMYGMATLVAYSRVHTHHHFARDVVGGAAIGTASAFFLTEPLAAGTHVGVLPNGDGVAFVLHKQW